MADSKAKRNQKATRIRRRIKANTASVADLKWLKDYEATKSPRGAQPTIATVTESLASDDTPDDNVADAIGGEGDGDDDAGGGADSEAGPETEGEETPSVVDAIDSAPVGSPAPSPFDEVHKAPPGPPPPPMPKGPRPSPGAPPKMSGSRTSQPPPRDGKREKWQDKYRPEKEGREQSVTFVADQWLNVLVGMHDAIKASGATPVVDPRTIYKALVLTVDEYMPEVELKPAHVAAAASTALLAQAFMNRKKIADVRDKGAARVKAEAETAARKARVENMQKEQRENAAHAEPTSTIEVVDATNVADAAAVTETAPDPVATNGRPGPLTLGSMRNSEALKDF